MMPFVLLRGKAKLKEWLGTHTALDPATLPYREDLLQFLRQQSRSGRRIILATGADQGIASAVAGNIGIFGECLASDGSANLTNTRKADAIRDHAAATGFQAAGFLYAGNSRDDLPIWAAANGAITVDASNRLRRQVGKLSTPVIREFSRERSTLRDVARAMRVHQWAKNLLVFVPLFLSHNLLNWPLLVSTAIGYLAFCATASCLYILNDLFDLPSDRRHPNKRNRPFASGALSIPFGLELAGVLAVGAIYLTTFLPSGGYLLAAYATLTILYSGVLKRLIIVDVVTLALLYTVRIYFGSLVTGIVITVWTAAFSIFLFMSLALAKRIAELRLLHLQDTSGSGRGYRKEDLPLLGSLASASGYLSVLVLALYLQSPEVTRVYSNPPLLWAACLLILVWISRILMIANRGEMHDDPVVFAMRDKFSWAVVALAALFVFLATIL